MTNNIRDNIRSRWPTHHALINWRVNQRFFGADRYHGGYRILGGRPPSRQDVAGQRRSTGVEHVGQHPERVSSVLTVGHPSERLGHRPQNYGDLAPLQRSPTMSVTMATSSGTVENLNVSARQGWIPCSRHTRATVS